MRGKDTIRMKSTGRRKSRGIIQDNENTKKKKKRAKMKDRDRVKSEESKGGVARER